jgi:hypothetical protein
LILPDFIVAFASRWNTLLRLCLMGLTIQRVCTLLGLAALTLGAAGCGLPFVQANPAHAGSCTLSLPAGVNDAEAIRALLIAEGELVVKQEIAPLMDLWVEGAFVANAKNTPHVQEDDQYWLDKDAIRHRYVRTVFPGDPQQATPADLTITLETDRAVVTATTRIGNEVSPAGDRWVLVKVGECWLIESLTYNLEPAPQK